MKNRYIAVEGAIGVGKTTLSKRISQTLCSELVLEDYYDNPFLKEFYKNNKMVFSTQLYFLLKRLEQIKEISIKKSSLVTDFYLEKDELFAKYNLSNNEYKIYKTIKQKLGFTNIIPDIIIYLQAPIDVLMKRIYERNLDLEKGIDKKYVLKISNIYADFFHNYDKSPVLIINTSNVDINNDRDYKILIDQISSDIKGKSYFNPMSSNS